MMPRALIALAVFATPLAADDAPWSTYRGNAHRTGNTDNIAPPAKPEVLWTAKLGENHFAPPVPCGNEIVLAGLGTFNSGAFHSLPAVAKDPMTVKPTWSKGGPFFSHPTLSSPAVADGKVIFGAGMHITDGAALYCLPADGGHLLWVVEDKGHLVHMEASPTVANGRVYTGGGSAGVMCFDLNTVTLNGKELPVKDVPALQATRLKELQAEYDAKKKTDEFANPPKESDLLRPAPKVLWTQGRKRWHVDAPVLVAGDKVLVGSSYLDKEKEGDRAVFCLDATTGKELWRAPLSFNPWGGPTLAGDTVVVTTSSIAYDPKLIEGARGEIVALDLATGKEKWKKAVPGGVLGCAAATVDAAVFTCTDGKVRAFDLKDGARKMIYDAKAPFFAPPAIVADTAYVGDLTGVIHAVDLKTGVARWTFDVGKEPVKLPGSHYGGVAIHGGRVYVATCNLEEPFARQPTVVLCLGAK